MNEVIKLHPATIRRSKGGEFLSVSDMFIENVDHNIANAVLARYYKGLEGESSNCVIVKFLGEDK